MIAKKGEKKDAKKRDRSKRTQKPVEVAMMRWSVNMTERGRLRAMKWCVEHGVEKPGDVITVEFYQERPGKGRDITAYVRRYARDDNGNLWRDLTGETVEHPVQEIPIPPKEYADLLREWSATAPVEPGLRWA